MKQSDWEEMTTETVQQLHESAVGHFAWRWRLNLRSRALLEKLRVAQPVKKFPTFTEHECSLQCSLGSATGSYPGSGESSSHPYLGIPIIRKALCINFKQPPCVKRDMIHVSYFLKIYYHTNFRGLLFNSTKFSPTLKIHTGTLLILLMVMVSNGMTVIQV
jgi:hypothetical protein